MPAPLLQRRYGSAVLDARPWPGRSPPRCSTMSFLRLSVSAGRRRERPLPPRACRRSSGVPVSPLTEWRRYADLSIEQGNAFMKRVLAQPKLWLIGNATVTSPLENLAGPGQPLRKEAPDAKEFAALRRSGLTHLADASKKRTLWRVDSTLPTTPPTHYASQRCATRDSAPRTDTSSSRFFRTPSVSVPRCGGCSPNVTTSVIARNTKVTSMSTSGCWPTSSPRARRSRLRSTSCRPF